MSYLSLLGEFNSIVWTSVLVCSAFAFVVGLAFNAYGVFEMMRRNACVFWLGLGSLVASAAGLALSSPSAATGLVIGAVASVALWLASART